MASNRKSIRLGIIGTDSSHTLAFIKEFKKYPDVEVSWVVSDNQTDLTFSKERSHSIEESLRENKITLLKSLDEAHEVDAYCILTLDSKTHLDIYRKIRLFDKPIFIDKPIFNNLEDFNEIDEKVFSSSALRYSSFIKDASKEMDKIPKEIIIEGPLSFIEGIDGYFWYGIHLVEMLHTLCGDNLKVMRYKKMSDCEEVHGEYSHGTFILRGITEGDPDFKVMGDDQVFSMRDYDESLYENLIKEILDFFRDEVFRVNGKPVIETILKINEMRKYYA